MTKPMTKAEIAKIYQLNENGIIQHSGKFDQQPYYSVQFYEWIKDKSINKAFYWFDGMRSYIFIIDDDCKREYPELYGVYALELYMFSNDHWGIVHFTSENNLDEYLSAYEQR